VKDKPVITLPFKDTLICSIDTLQLKASGPGIAKWSPNVFISNTNIFNPLVYPKDTIVYKITVNDNGCINEDSITVNVLDFITVQLGPDTGICRTDSFVLKPKTDALNFLWTPATGLSSTSIKNPVAQPLNTIKYFVTANLGKCQDKDSITIFVTPYPQAIASADTAICFNSSVMLNASIVGSKYFWSPTSSMINATTLHPTVRPFFTTNYVLTVFDSVGCPKPAYDTVKVVVLPQIIANAGNDTSVVANQPLQLTATGGTTYQWSPTTGMNDPNIFNPVVTLGPTVDSILYTVTVSEGFCSATDNILVRVFKSAPDIYVPSAFTPNHDQKNDIVKPILRGMKSLELFPDLQSLG
jgi:hypothetical protein